MMSMRHAAIALLVLLLLVVLGRKRLRQLISRRLRLHMLMTDGGRSVPSELLVSTLSWRYDTDADESENDPCSPRLLSSANARSRRRWGQQPSPPKPVVPLLRRRDFREALCKALAYVAPAYPLLLLGGSVALLVASRLAGIPLERAHGVIDLGSIHLPL